MPKFDSPFAAQKYRKKQRLQREAEAAIYPDDKLRVRPTHYQTVATRSGKQILKFRPTDVIDDPHRIRIMDELGVQYIVLSLPPEEDETEPEPDPTTEATVALQEGGPSTGSTLATIPNALALATVPLVLATVPAGNLDALTLAPGSSWAWSGATILASISPASLATIPDVDEHTQSTATGEGMPEPAAPEHEPEPEPEGDWEPKG